MTAEEGRNGRQKWQSDLWQWQRDVAEAAKCGKNGRIGRTIRGSDDKMSLANGNWQADGKRGCQRRLTKLRGRQN